MAKAAMHVAYYFFLLTFCIDEGDGRWKKTDKEILQRDIKLYRKIAERVEHELKEYYDEYTGEELQQFYDRQNYQPYKNVVKIDKEETITKEHNQEYKFSNDIPVNNTIINNSVSSDKAVPNSTLKKMTRTRGQWPKFEEMLLAMGKKYDWKNDRWIKIKEKYKNKRNDVSKLDNSIIFHEKHRFSYRSVKLNRGKNKRNVVIAVTAIR